MKLTARQTQAYKLALSGEKQFILFGGAYCTKRERPLSLQEKAMKQIPGFDARYLCDEDGNLYSDNYKNSGKLKMISPALDKKGYLRTMLLNDKGQYQTVKVHRLIASAFIAQAEGKNQVNHLNGIKSDNRVSNLEWCDNRENVIHAYKNNMISTNKGIDHHKSILRKISPSELVESFNELKSIKLVAKKYKIDRHAVSRNLKRIISETHIQTNSGV